MSSNGRHIQNCSIVPVLTSNIADKNFLLIVPSLEILTSFKGKALGDFSLNPDDFDVLLGHIPG